MPKFAKLDSSSGEVVFHFDLLRVIGKRGIRSKPVPESSQQPTRPKDLIISVDPILFDKKRNSLLQQTIDSLHHSNTLRFFFRTRSNCLRNGGRRIREGRVLVLGNRLIDLLQVVVHILIQRSFRDTAHFLYVGIQVIQTVAQLLRIEIL